MSAQGYFADSDHVVINRKILYARTPLSASFGKVLLSFVKTYKKLMKINS